MWQDVPFACQRRPITPPPPAVYGHSNIFPASEPTACDTLGEMLVPRRAMPLLRPRARLHHPQYPVPREAQAAAEAQAPDPRPGAHGQLRVDAVGHAHAALGRHAAEARAARQDVAEPRVRHLTAVADVQTDELRAVRGDVPQQRVAHAADPTERELPQARARGQHRRDRGRGGVVAAGEAQRPQALAVPGGGPEPRVGDVLAAVQAQVLGPGKGARMGGRPGAHLRGGVGVVGGSRGGGVQPPPPPS